MSYENEAAMYPDVIKWLKRILTHSYPDTDVNVYDTSKVILSKFLLEKKLHTAFPYYQTYEIQVDITGVIRSKDFVKLVFVECKLNKINLRDLSQLLGYSKVANPRLSIILSPAGFSDSINFLFNVHRRIDILYYNKNHFIRIAKWLKTRQDIDYANILPKGSTIV